MPTFDKTQAGKFRGNPYASQHNNLRLVDPNNPGTPLEDTVSIDTTGATLFSGFTYTDKNGVTAYHDFKHEVFKGGQEVPYTVGVSEGREALMLALGKGLGKFEVDPVVTVEGAAAAFDVLHIGSGILVSVRMDGADQAASRGAITALETIQIEAQTEEAGKTSGGKKKAAKA